MGCARDLSEVNNRSKSAGTNAIVTVRTYKTTLEAFETYQWNLRWAMETKGFIPFYDANVSLDKGWLNVLKSRFDQQRRDNKSQERNKYKYRSYRLHYFISPVSKRPNKSQRNASNCKNQ